MFDATRRDFIKTTALASAGLSTLAFKPQGHGQQHDHPIRVGLVGCGGRGTGAARDCVVAAEGVTLVAMGDLFADRLETSKAALLEAIPEQYQVTDDSCFVGFDAYQQVIDSDIDLVILATPPGYRPQHFAAAVAAGKHVFMEKPACVDAAGHASILASGKEAQRKGLAVVAGTLYRRQPSFMASVARIHDGMIGEITGAQAYYLTGPIWLRERKPGMSDMEWQCRNWYYFTWLSGDHIVEQFVHNLDVIQWVMQANPEKALGMGGRIQRTAPEYGHIYDHFSIEYAYANDVRVEAKCRQMEGCTGLVTNRIIGTKGIADLHPSRSQIRAHDGTVLFDHPERGNNAYVQEHTDLIESIRMGQPINEAAQLADATLMAVLGRESAYTGQLMTWQEVMDGAQDLTPPALAWGPMPTPPVAVPGSKA